jgi:glycosyltransferase involved in cell wall biosynthesis
VTVSFAVVPVGIDDPASPSGGNRYDRRVCDGLRALGREVRELAVPGAWPRPDAAALTRLADVLRALPDGTPVLLDGLIASPAGAVLVPEAARLRLAVLVHMPFGGGAVAADAEAAVLRSARVVVTTSAWTRQRLLARYGLAPDRVRVARPGVDPVGPAPGTPSGGRLLCVAAVVAHKGQDVLVEALGGLRDRFWTCTFAGPLDREPDFVAALYRRIADAGIADRVHVAGPLGRDELDRRYRAADLLVVPSRLESYGMAVTEALAAGLPVVAVAVGGVAEAVGRARDAVPGLLVPPDDPPALRAALARWLDDAVLRSRLRSVARERGAQLDGWDRTARELASALDLLAAEGAR